jgi:glycosyltransferase involved in cell wall biosynthesis
LYENAVAFIFPSLYEGFGLPPLEAMRCGCPVICSNSASIPEICGDAALYFDPTNLSEIRSQIQHLVDNPPTQKLLKQNGVLRAQSFTWDRAAQSLLTILKEISFS